MFLPILQRDYRGNFKINLYIFCDKLFTRKIDKGGPGFYKSQPKIAACQSWLVDAPRKVYQSNKFQSLLVTKKSQAQVKGLLKLTLHILN